MCNRKKQNLKMIPTFLMVALLVVSGFLKITGHHPMILHFVTTGYRWLASGAGQC